MKTAIMSAVGEMLGLIAGIMGAMIFVSVVTPRHSDNKRWFILIVIAGIFFNVFHATFTARVFCGEKSSVFFMAVSLIVALVFVFLELQLIELNN